MIVWSVGALVGAPVVHVVVLSTNARDWLTWMPTFGFSVVLNAAAISLDKRLGSFVVPTTVNKPATTKAARSLASLLATQWMVISNEIVTGSSSPPSRRTFAAATAFFICVVELTLDTTLAMVPAKAT